MAARRRLQCAEKKLRCRLAPIVLPRSEILLVQVGTLSFSHPSFGMSVLFIYTGLARTGTRLVRLGRKVKNSQAGSDWTPTRYEWTLDR